MSEKSPEQTTPGLLQSQIFKGPYGLHPSDLAKGSEHTARHSSLCLVGQCVAYRAGDAFCLAIWF